MDAGYSGTTSTLDVMHNFWGWQVVYPDGVRDDQWQEFVEVYINDKYELGTREWFSKANPTAMAQMSEQILEAIRKGYFRTDAKTIEKLIVTMEEFSRTTDYKSGNKKLKEFIAAQKRNGYGLQVPIAQPKPKANMLSQPTPQKQAPQVKGQQLEEVKIREKKESNTSLLLWLFIGLLIAIGATNAAREHRR